MRLHLLLFTKKDLEVLQVLLAHLRVDFRAFLVSQDALEVMLVSELVTKR